MIDKVQKIREEIERLKRWNDNVRESTRHMTLQEEDFNRGKHSSYLEILNFIDSMQEEPVSKQKLSNVGRTVKNWKEPVSEDLEREIDSYFSKWLQGASDEGCFNPDSQLVSIYDCHRIARHFANWQKQQMERYRIEHCKSLTNEQAELESNFVSSHVEKNNRIPTFIDAIEYGIEYGKQQKDESKVLTEEQCRKIRDDAFELGKDAMKQQLMTKAVDATVHIDAGGYPYIPQMELHDYGKDIPLAKEGDKYKVVLIKKD